VQGDLTLAGQPPTVDPNSYGVVATLTPATASAGQDTSAVYTVQVTNTGSSDSTFTLTAAGLPAGVKATFSQAAVDVPPGASNFRDVKLTLTPSVGTAAGNDPFSVTATSTTASGKADGTLTVVSQGVSVTLNPSTGAPGSTFQMKVTNTGTARDTFNLALGGPAALVAQPALSQVTLDPGASQVVNVTTGAVSFAVQGPLTLTATATSQTNPGATDEATAALRVPASTGLTDGFTPASQTLTVPGAAPFLLQVNNTGNSEDAYTASITGTTGPITASLIGLDGQPTQSIPVFRLPGLSSGAIELQTTATGRGTGTVTIEVHSLTNSNQAPTIATLVVGAASSPTAPPPPPPAATGMTITGVTEQYGLLYQRETVTALVTAGGVPVSGGQVTLTDNGQAQTVNVGANGQATAVFTFDLLRLQEQPFPHAITESGGGTSLQAPNTVLDFLFQLLIDYEIVKTLQNNS
jgi:hypothetical protein